MPGPNDVVGFGGTVIRGRYVYPQNVPSYTDVYEQRVSRWGVNTASASYTAGEIVGFPAVGGLTAAGVKTGARVGAKAAARRLATHAAAREAAAEDVLATPRVASSKLQNIINDLYKGTTNPGRVGTGTTADAVRYELRTGKQVYGRSHVQKAEDYLSGLENWLKVNPDAPYHDRLVARSLADDLLDALGRAP